MSKTTTIAVVDYGVGNVYSVIQACGAVGLDARLSRTSKELLAADAVVLPGVGAYGTGMSALNKLGLVGALHEVAARGTPLIGICLGMQLLMSGSEEFGGHEGLGVFDGPVIRLPRQMGPLGELKVPQVGWNSIRRRDVHTDWMRTPLNGVQEGDFMYFVHSFYVRPTDSAVSIAVTKYGDVEICSSVARDNVFACQFHPERSGRSGLQIYRNIGKQIIGHSTKEEFLA